MGGLPNLDKPPAYNKYNIQEMWDIHHHIKRLLLIGMKEVDIAAQLGVTREMVCYTKNSPIVQRELMEMRAALDLGSIDIAKRIQEIAAEAVEKMADHVKSEQATISLRASQDMLDRAGYGAVKKEAHLHGHLTADDIEEIKRRSSSGRRAE